MTLKDNIRAAKNKYLSHPLLSWILGVACALLFCVLLIPNLIDTIVGVFLIPFIGLPFLFSIIVMHYRIKDNVEISASNSFRHFALYFTFQFRSSFSVLMSFLKTLIFELVFSIVMFIIVYACFKNFVPSFNDELMSFWDYLTQYANMEITIEQFFEIINTQFYASDSSLYRFLIWILLPSYFVSILFFTYLISIESLSIFAKFQLKQTNPSFVRACLKGAIKEHKKEFYGSYFGLNWPLFVLMIIGFVLGSLISFRFTTDYDIVMVIGASSGFALLSFFLPFYLNNMESIYDSLSCYVIKTSEDISNRMLNELQLQKQLYEKEVEDLKDTIDSFAKKSENQNSSDEEQE